MNIRLVLFLALLSTGCTTASAARNPVFATPDLFVDRRVHVCGYMIDSSNIVESRSRNDRVHSGGVSIIEKGPLNLLHRGRVCVEGTISRIGCETGPDLCTDAAFDYGIRIQRVLHLR